MQSKHRAQSPGGSSGRPFTSASSLDSGRDGVKSLVSQQVGTRDDDAKRPKPPPKHLDDDQQDTGKKGFWSDFINRKDYYDDDGYEFK